MVYLEYVSVKELYNKYCFNIDLNFEIGTSKTIILFKTFHIRALTLVNDLEPMGTSWLDHVLCSQDMQTKLHSIAILDMLPSSGHVPLSFVFDFNSSPTFNDTFTCPSNKTSFNWAIATDKDLTDYKYLTRI